MSRPGRPARLLTALLVAPLLAGSAAQPARRHGSAGPAVDRPSVTATVAARPGSASDHSVALRREGPDQVGPVRPADLRDQPGQGPQGLEGPGQAGPQAHDQGQQDQVPLPGQDQGEAHADQHQPRGHGPGHRVPVREPDRHAARPVGLAGRAAPPPTAPGSSTGAWSSTGRSCARWRNGFGRGPRYGIQGTRGQVAMHEIAHALGPRARQAPDADHVPVRHPQAGGVGRRRLTGPPILADAAVARPATPSPAGGLAADVPRDVGAVLGAVEGDAARRRRTPRRGRPRRRPPVPTTASTRPPAVTSDPSRRAVPAWMTCTPSSASASSTPVITSPVDDDSG